MIQFVCEHCGRRLTVTDAHAGKKGRCPVCKQTLKVPQTGARPKPDAEHHDKPDAAPKWSTQDAALLNLSPELSVPEAHGSGDTISEADVQDAANEKVEEGRDASAEGPARFTDVLAYPANLDGLVQIMVLAFFLWLVRLFGGVFAWLAGPYGRGLMIAGQVIVGGYIVFYIGYCVYDSSQGGRRAATISLAHTPDLGDLISQLLLLAGGVAICFWPAALYRGVAGRVDMGFWALGLAGAFFLPMSLLTAALFDGIDALNPLLIVRSILVTLPTYIKLLAKLGLLAGVSVAIHVALGRIPLPRILLTAAHLYLLLVGAHLLGRFYWCRKGRLGWGL